MVIIFKDKFSEPNFDHIMHHNQSTGTEREFISLSLAQKRLAHKSLFWRIVNFC